MEKETILLLDFCSSSGLGAAVKRCLQPEPGSLLNLHYQEVRLGNALLRSDVTGILDRCRPGLVLPVLASKDLSTASDFLQGLTSREPRIPIIAITDSEDPHEMMNLLRLGVADYITPPFKAMSFFPRIWRLLREETEENRLISTLRKKLGLRQLVGKSPAFLREVEKIPVVARCDASVLITGETGTGKELFARAIHYCSPRSAKPFIPVNCGALPADLVESELFGHVRGAFTGATQTNLGIIREADGGTLFLDEIDSLPLGTQAKFLRFLQEKEYRQVGSGKILHADVRIIASTNTDIQEAVKKGTFRKDLFYRLSVVPVRLPRLRERREDIPLMARHFLRAAAQKLKKDMKDFTAEALHKLVSYEWPGNVRELENIVQRSAIFSTKQYLDKEDIHLERENEDQAYESFQHAKERTIARFEREYIEALLLAHNGNISRAAKAANKDRRAFWEIMRKHDINPHSFKSNPAPGR